MDNQKARDAIRVAIGKEIRAARVRQGVTQVQLADMLADHEDLSHTTLVRLESGKRAASLEQLLAICDALDADPGAILNAAQASKRSQQ